MITGAWKAHVGLSPIDENDADRFKRAKTLINSEPPVNIKQSEIEKKNKKLQKFIQKELQHYENVTKDEHDFKHISPNMNIRDEYLN